MKSIGPEPAPSEDETMDMMVAGMRAELHGFFDLYRVTFDLGRGEIELQAI